MSIRGQQTETATVPTREQQRSQLRKPRYADAGTAPLLLRPILAIEDLLRSILIRLGVPSRLVTFAWFVTAIAAYGFTAFGTPLTVVIGALLVYLKIALDLVDGELGRYQKQFMTPEQDLRTHMQGVYLDRIQHLVESPLWGLALGVGAFRQTEIAWLLLAGVALSIHRGFSRFDKLLKRQLFEMFRERIEGTPDDRGTASRQVRRTLAQRGWSSLVFWIRNGKRFNFLILAAGITDLLLAGVTTAAVPCFAVLVGSAGVIALLDTCLRIAGTQIRADFVVTVTDSVAGTTRPEKEPNNS